MRDDSKPCACAVRRDPATIAARRRTALDGLCSERSIAVRRRTGAETRAAGVRMTGVMTGVATTGSRIDQRRTTGGRRRAAWGSLRAVTDGLRRTKTAVLSRTEARLSTARVFGRGRASALGFRARENSSRSRAHASGRLAPAGTPSGGGSGGSTSARPPARRTSGAPSESIGRHRDRRRIRAAAGPLAMPTIDVMAPRAGRARRARTISFDIMLQTVLREWRARLDVSAVTNVVRLTRARRDARG